MLSLESKRAMFKVALVAQCAGEPVITARRVVAALLRTDSVRELCSRAGIDQTRLFEVVDDPRFPSFEECERRVTSDRAVQLPLEPALRQVFDPIIERHGHLGASPLELLRDILRADAALAELLASHGLTAESLR